MRPPAAPVVLMVLASCGPPSAFTDAELEDLNKLVMEEGVMPHDPTNAWSDDAGAAKLGHKFFFDARFSGPIVLESDLGAPGEMGKISCASCHEPGEGGADVRSSGPTSHGAEWTGRNSPTVLNAAYLHTSVFWDGRKDSLWSQALGPSEAEAEHNGSRALFAQVVFEHYRAEYEAVFGPMPEMSDTVLYPAKDTLCDAVACGGKPGDAIWTAMSPEAQEDINLIFVNYGKAVGAYERLLVTPNSPFDAYMRGDLEAMGPEALRGAKLFVGKASCNECHTGPALADGRYHNLGVPHLAEEINVHDDGRADGIEQLLADVFNAKGPYSDDTSVSDHLDGLEAKPEDVAAFKTPTLRNVAQTGPYMHNGSIPTLWDVVDFYRFGGQDDDSVGVHDPAVAPLDLTDDEVHDLVAFLESLTGSLPAELTEAPELP